jgi:vacuolar-type H+-ATPase subunit H
VKTNAAPPPAADLSRLVEAERRLDERLAAARAEAAGIVDAARAAARALDAGLAAELEESDRRLSAAAAAELARRAEGIEAAARRATETFAGLDEARIGELADHVVARVAGPDEGHA